ncbi:MAG: purine-nucleoside phosphorylase [Gemmataceae bacterium]
MPPHSAFTTLTEAARREQPRLALVLGSGLGRLADRLEEPQSVPFLEVPGMAGTSVGGHQGRLTLGRWAGRSVLLFEGRLHYYEGHSWQRVTHPAQTAAFLGVKVLLLTNAVGGIADELQPGSLMAIRDHIDWTRPYWWRHPGPGGLGPERPSPYSARLRELLRQSAHQAGVELREGIYAQVTGPSYETPAEVRALRACGAAAVGMSTGREAQAAVQLGLECAAISMITNRAAGLSAAPIHHDEVLHVAIEAGQRLARVVEVFVQRL